MVYTNSTNAMELTRLKDIATTTSIPNLETKVMVATRMHGGACLVDNVVVTVEQGAMALPEIERDD